MTNHIMKNGKLLLVITALVCALLAAVAYAQLGKPPKATPLSHETTGRFVLFQGTFKTYGEKTKADQHLPFDFQPSGVFKLDIETGDTWIYVQGWLDFPDSDSMFVRRWVAIKD